MTRRALAAVVALPLLVGVVAVLAALRRLLRLARGEPASEDPDVPTPEPSVGLAVGLAVDSLVTLPVGLLASTGTTSAYRRSSDELDAAITLYDALGWLEAPLRRHLPPPPLTDPDLAPGRAAGLETLRFPSGWAPQEDEPGRERWQSFADNRRVPVTLLRHGDRPRPWLIAVHGQGMGRPSDVRMLGVRRLHHELGVNVAMPVLPLHGARAAGFDPGTAVRLEPLPAQQRPRSLPGGLGPAAAADLAARGRGGAGGRCAGRLARRLRGQPAVDPGR